MFELLGSVGFFLMFVFAVLAVLIPVWLYLINVYTYQTRNEIRKLNTTIGRLVDTLEKQAQPVQDDNKAGGAIESACQRCGKRFRHSSSISGTKKDCPGCGHPVYLN